MTKKEPDFYLSGDSKKYKNWQSLYDDMRTCKPCKDNHGKIYEIKEIVKWPAHMFCRCKIIPMRTKEVGTATDRGFDGADAWVMYRQQLPPYYVTKEEARKKGWVPDEGNLADVIPEFSVGGNVYHNKEDRLPRKNGRVWYEADINYIEGYRGHERMLYSNDGLIFVTYDHYQTFYEITK